MSVNRIISSAISGVILAGSLVMMNPASAEASSKRLAENKPLTTNASISSHWSGKRWHPVLKRYRKHDGTDYRAKCGAKILATHSGKVSRNSYDRGGYGYWIEVKSGHNTTRYAHMRKKALPKQGATIHAGQLLGYVGNTGTSTGCHLHYEQRYKNKSYNAAKYVKAAKLLKNNLTVKGNIKKRWSLSSHGSPKNNMRCSLKGGGCVQSFTKADIYWKKKTGAHATRGAIRSKWKAHKSEKGALGYPTSGQLKFKLDHNARIQKFEKGVIVWSPKTKAHAIHGSFSTAWKKQGWNRGLLKYPTSGQQTFKYDKKAKYQSFQNGLIVQSKKGTYTVSGSFSTAWKKQGWERGELGYPTSNSYKSGGKTWQKFENGKMYLHKGKGVIIYN